MLSYVRGDATQPVGEGPKFIVHCCNDLGLWGAGFVLAISRRWAEPEEAYYNWNGGVYSLGDCQIVRVDDDLYVLNMIGQHGVGRRGSSAPPIRYGAIRRALQQVAAHAVDPVIRGPYRAASIHCPRFGAGLAGGDWNKIEQIIQDELVSKGLSVTIYDYDG
ncbi:MAG: Appr-1-p processing protein [Nitrospira sp.]